VNHAVKDWLNVVIVCISVETCVERVTRFCVPTIQCWTLIILLSKIFLEFIKFLQSHYLSNFNTFLSYAFSCKIN